MERGLRDVPGQPRRGRPPHPPRAPAHARRGRGTVVNNASISGYAYFPAASTYAASKAGVVALSESLRRELKGTGVGVLHVVTPGVNTDMLDATEAVYGRHMDTSGWDKVEPAEWAEKVLEAVEEDRHILGPGRPHAPTPSSPPAALPSCSTRSAAGCSAGSRGHSRRRRGREHVDAGERLGEHRLHEPDPVLGEARLAVAEIHPPDAAEALVVAEGLEPLGRRLEVRPPAAQRLGVVRGEVLEVDRAQVGARSRRIWRSPRARAGSRPGTRRCG